MERRQQGDLSLMAVWNKYRTERLAELAKEALNVGTSSKRAVERQI